DSNYKNLEAHLLPSTESLKDTQLRVVNYFYEAIVPQLSLDKTVLVTAHGNSLRALIANLGHIAENDVPHIDVPTGTPFLYEFDGMLNLMSHQKLS
ncbi:MAG TPA: 2,3-bisphosphoglycerate-dependent phosphoglycerate mutase, partial [Pricia sp.]|nr:2,3-bisphosphoglycerate-dependent phosphoglycerate mutase [Pricia sp.]